MKTKLVRIGNSRGVRLPKPLIEESGLSEEVELLAGDRTILIRSAVGPRAGWAEAAAALARREEACSTRLPPPASTRTGLGDLGPLGPRAARRGVPDQSQPHPRPRDPQDLVAVNRLRLGVCQLPWHLTACLLATPDSHIATCTTRSFPARFASYIA